MTAEIFILSGFVSGVFSLIFGLFVIAKDWRSRVNQLFFLMTSAAALWGLGYQQWLLSPEHDQALFWVRMLSLGALFTPALFFHWVASMLGIARQKKVAITAAYAALFLVLPFSFSQLFIAGVEPKLFFPFWPTPGPIYSFYLPFLFVAPIAYTVFLLIKDYRHNYAERGGQVFYILLGALFGFSGAATNFPLWYGIPLVPYGNFFVVLFPFFLGYAVLRHRLFNLKIIATELLVFAICAFLFVRALLAPLWQERAIDGILFALVASFGILLVRSVMNEVHSREQIAKLAQELARSNEELKRLDAAKSEFISLAGHQLRAPLTVIRGYTSLLLEGELGPITERAADEMRKVSVSAEELVKLVGDLLDLSRIEAGRMKYNFQPILADDVVGEVLRELEVNTRAKGLELNFQSRNTAKRTVNADPDKFREVVMNLVDNAIKYTAAGKITVELYPEINQGRTWLVLKVADTGIGIKPADIPTLFAKFARTEEAKRVRTDGLGLGLYFVKRIVEDHDGRLWVESPGTGKGSTFFVALPCGAERLLDK